MPYAPTQRITHEPAARLRKKIGTPSTGFVVALVVLATAAALVLPPHVGATGVAGPYWLAIPAIIAGGRFGMRGAVLAGLAESVIGGPLSGHLPGAPIVAASAWPAQTLFLLIVSVVVATLVRRIKASDAEVMRLLDQQRAAALAAAEERGELTQKLQRRVAEDALTGLATREAFTVALKQRLARGQTVAVLFIDLDDFKTVNDTLGHSVGDELLVNVARRLSTASRDTDVVARFGGDEFAVMFDDLPAAHALSVAQRLVGELRSPFTLAGRTVTVRASGGLATSQGLATNGIEQRAADLLRQSDLAMYASKTERTHGVTVYHDDMHTEMMERLSLESDLHHAVAGYDVYLAYQPIIELATRRIRSVEALMRWQHPTRGMVPPHIFIPAAEQTGMIVPLTMWALRESCVQLRKWTEQVPNLPLSVALNVSGRFVREPGVGSAVARELHRAGIPPEQVTFEITESLLTDDRSTAVRTLCQLRALGCRLSVDDFGTGYSSLSRLNTLPIDEVKIDQSFVSQLEHGDAGRTIITASVAMAHGLGLRVIAEGIETEGQLNKLLDIGCDEGQGFLFARPENAERITQMLAEDEAAAPSAVTPLRPVPNLPLPRATFERWSGSHVSG